jgi:hypothetical protein
MTSAHLGHLNLSAITSPSPTFQDHVPADYLEPMRSLIVVALTLTVLAAAGCAGDDDADPTTTRNPAATSVVTSEPAATIPPTTERSTTTSAPTTAAPTTTIDPTEALIADIEADLNAGEQALMAAGADPSNPVLRAEVERYFADAGLVRVNEFLDGLAQDGLVNRPNPDVPNAIVVRRLIDAASDDQASVEICRIDAAVVYEPIGTSEAIVNDQIIRTTSEVVFRKLNGVWVSRGDGDILESTEGATECA